MKRLMPRLSIKTVSIIAFLTAILLTCIPTFVSMSPALGLSDAERTVPLNDEGEEITLTEEQVLSGQEIFTSTCSQCHQGGQTKTAPDLNLSLETLAFAYPSRDNIEGLVAFLNQPTTYDGEVEISELHPSIASADIYPEMRQLSQDDLKSIAGYLLVAPQIYPDWGGQSAQTR